MNQPRGLRLAAALMTHELRENAQLQERIQLLETLLRDTEAAEMLHQNCWFCSGESSPLRCERCAVMYADLRERRRQALPGGGGGC